MCISKAINFKKHLIEQTITPDIDSEAFLAYLVLNSIRSSTSYLSYDGYHTHGLADYVAGIYWQSTKIVDNFTKETLHETKDFNELSRKDIVKIWLSVLGYTSKLKRDLVRSI